MDINFAGTLYADNSSHVYTVAQEMADANGAPVGIWKRDGWLTIDENPPDEDDEREAAGWVLTAVVDPSSDDSGGPAPADCPTCDGYVLNALEAPYCPSCARERKDAR